MCESSEDQVKEKSFDTFYETILCGAVKSFIKDFGVKTKWNFLKECCTGQCRRGQNAHGELFVMVSLLPEKKQHKGAIHIGS